MNLGIESYTMYIYSAADANKAKYNNPNDIVQVAEKGNFDGVIGDLRPIATSEFRYINTKKNPQLREWSELDSDKWEQEKTFGKFNHDYFGTSLNEAGLGTSVYVVFVLVITAESKAAVGDNVKNRVTKASGHIINPNTQGINAVNDPTFGRR
jgi:hypothetical protein